MPQTAAKAAEEAERAAEKLKEEEREFQNARRYESGNNGRRTANSRSDSFGESMVKVVVKELKGTTGRRIVRGILGGLFKAR